MPSVLSFELAKRINGPMYGRPLKLIVNASDRFDPLFIAQKGIDGTLKIKPESYNVLELCDAFVRPCQTYTGLQERHKLDSDFQGFFLDPSIVRGNLVYFDGVSEFILMGGRVSRSLKWAFITLLAIKTPISKKKIIDMFSEKKDFQGWAKNNIDEVRKLPCVNEQVLNIHFNAQALFPACDDLSLTDEKGVRLGKIDYGDLAAVLETDNKFYGNIHDAIYRGLPVSHRHLLQNAGIRIYQHIDGLVSAKPVCEEGDGGFTLNLYYWPSTEKLARYLTRSDPE